MKKNEMDDPKMGNIGILENWQEERISLTLNAMPNGAKRPPRSVSHTDYGGSLRKPLETTLSTGRNTPSTISTHFNVLSQSGR